MQGRTMRTERLSAPPFAAHFLDRLLIIGLIGFIVVGLLFLVGLRDEALIVPTIAVTALIGIAWLMWDRTRPPSEDVADHVDLFGIMLILRRGREVENIPLSDLLCVETLRTPLWFKACLRVRTPDEGSRRIHFAPRWEGQLHPYADLACIARLGRAAAEADRQMPTSADALDADIPVNVLALRGGSMLSHPDGEAFPFRKRFLLFAMVAMVLTLAVVVSPRAMPWGPAICAIVFLLFTCLARWGRVATGRICAKEVYLRNDTFFVEHPNGTDKVDLRDVIGYEVVFRGRLTARPGSTPIPSRPGQYMGNEYSELELRLARPYAFGDRLRFRPDHRLYQVFGDLGGLIAAIAQLASRARRLKDAP